MTRTLQGWWRNATDALDLMWTEPLSWLVMAGAAVWIYLANRKAGRVQPIRTLAIGGLGVWLVAAFAITIYPIDLEAPAAYRVEVKSFVPLWGTVESFADADGYLMTDAQWTAERERIARDSGVPAEQINLERRVRGAGITVLKDPIGNVVLFLPLGLLAALGWPSMRDPRRIVVAGASVSGSIELSQMLFSLGSLGTIDDVIFNTMGGFAGFAVFLLAERLTDAVVAEGR